MTIIRLHLLLSIHRNPQQCLKMKILLIYFKTAYFHLNLWGSRVCGWKWNGVVVLGWWISISGRYNLALHGILSRLHISKIHKAHLEFLQRFFTVSVSKSLPAFFHDLVSPQSVSREDVHFTEAAEHRTLTSNHLFCFGSVPNDLLCWQIPESPQIFYLFSGTCVFRFYEEISCWTQNQLNAVFRSHLQQNYSV